MTHILDDPDRRLEVQRRMAALGWEFYMTGPNEGSWLLAEGDRFVAHQGDERWNRDLEGILVDMRRESAPLT